MSNNDRGTGVAARSGGAAARTRGGWAPAGTAAARRVAHGERTTAKGLRTRDELVAAARRVFERDGYAGARVADIASGAGVAHGSFYTYFSSKQDAFLAVMRDVGAQFREAIAGSPGEGRRRGGRGEGGRGEGGRGGGGGGRGGRGGGGIRVPGARRFQPPLPGCLSGQQRDLGPRRAGGDDRPGDPRDPAARAAPARGAGSGDHPPLAGPRDRRPGHRPADHRGSAGVDALQFRVLVAGRRRQL